MPKNKTALLVAGAAVVAAGSVATYLYFKGIPGKGTTALESAKLVPDEALMAAFISTDSQSWGKLQQFGSPEAQQAIAGGLQNFQAQFFAGSNIDFQRDLQPWVGGVMFAYMPAQNATETTKKSQASDPNLLMVIGIQNKIKALEFANRLKAQQKAKVEEKNYQGVSISNILQENGTRYSSAVVGDYLLLAFQPQTMEAAIDTFKGEPSFAKKAVAANILTKGVDLENPLGEVYITDYASLVKQYFLSTPNAPKVSPMALKQLEQVKTAVVALGVDKEGLRLKSNTQFNPESVQYQFKPTPGKVISQFPSQTIALINGYGMKQYWNDLVRESDKTPEIKASLDQFRQSVKNGVNLDADKELFGWMDGEFAFGLIASNQGILSQFGFGSALIFETSDRKTAEGTLDKLQGLIKQQVPFLISDKRQVNGHEITDLKMPQGTVLSYGWLNDKSLFVALGSLGDTLANKSSNSLDNSPTFKSVTGSLPKSNLGYFYLDMDQAASIVDSIFTAGGSPIPPQNKAILNSIRGVSVTGTWPDKSTNQMEMLFSLKPKNK